MAEETTPSNPTAANEASPETSKARLTDLTQQAAQKYFTKDYNAASDLYAQATELQAALNGEMANENAELLFLYGRSLYQVGVNSSDVLGGKVAGEASVEDSSNQNAVNQKTKASSAKEGSKSDTPGQKQGTGKALLQFAGDEAWDSGDEDEEEEDAAGAADGEAAENAEPEEDDFNVAWESLDLARLLFERTLQEQQKDDNKGKAVGDSAETKHIKERLADTHDILAEISLEHENFSAAVNDFRASLNFKKELYPTDTDVIAEAHYKLSLSLEFASIKRENDDQQTGSDNKGQEIEYDKAVRDEAAQQMEAAILSTRARVAKEEQMLASGEQDEQKQTENKKIITKESIEEIKEIIADMEQRLVDLQKPPVTVEAATESASFADGSHPLSGILGSLLNASAEERKAKIEEVMKGANDLSGLVRRSKPTNASMSKQNEKVEDEKNDENGAINGLGKRKAVISEDGDDAGDAAGSSFKKAKVEDESHD